MVVRKIITQSAFISYALKISTENTHSSSQELWAQTILQPSDNIATLRQGLQAEQEHKISELTQVHPRINIPKHNSK